MKGLRRTKVLTVRDVADRVGWAVQRTRRVLLKGGALRRRGHLYYTTPEILQTVFPEILRDVERCDDDDS
jgi:hypothetical protein